MDDNNSDVQTFFSHSDENDKTKSDNPNKMRNPSSCTWSPTKLQPLPFYPLERSSRFVKDDLTTVVDRVSEANRLLSVHAVYSDETATATLLTSENVEMHLFLWKTSENQEGIVIEIQRCKGDSINFHKYSRYILDAAAGVLDIHNHIETNGEDIDVVHSKNVHQRLSLNESKNEGTEKDDAICAVEIAHGLLMKDHRCKKTWSRESLFTDRSKEDRNYNRSSIKSYCVTRNNTQHL